MGSTVGTTGHDLYYHSEIGLTIPFRFSGKPWRDDETPLSCSPRCWTGRMRRRGMRRSGSGLVLDRRHLFIAFLPSVDGLTSAARCSPSGQWRPAHLAAHPDPQRRNARQRGRGWGSSAEPGRAQRRGIGRAVRARACSIAASSNTSRPGSPNAATVTMTSGRCRNMWSVSSAATSTAASSLMASPARGAGNAGTIS